MAKAAKKRPYVDWMEALSAEERAAAEKMIAQAGMEAFVKAAIAFNQANRLPGRESLMAERGWMLDAIAELELAALATPGKRAPGIYALSTVVFRHYQEQLGRDLTTKERFTFRDWIGANYPKGRDKYLAAARARLSRTKKPASRRLTSRDIAAIARLSTGIFTPASGGFSAHVAGQLLASKDLQQAVLGNLIGDPKQVTAILRAVGAVLPNASDD